MVGKRMKGSTMVLIGSMAAVIVVLGVTIGVLLNRPTQSQEEPQNSHRIERNFVDENNVESVVSEIEEKVEDGMFECMMTTSWTFSDGKSESPNAYVANVESNRYTFCFDVYNQETDDLLYSSPFIPVGSEIRNFALDKELSAGEYKAVVKYILVDDNQEEVSTVGFTVTITVLQ